MPNPPYIQNTKSTLTAADKEEIADLFEERIRKLAKDETFTKVVYKESYNEMSRHALDSLSLWIGRKIIMVVAGAALSSVLVWALLTKGPK